MLNIQKYVDSIHDLPSDILKALEDIDREEQEKREFGWMENYVPPKDRK